jgi:glycyl-tRNA synthetase beta subunit
MKCIPCGQQSYARLTWLLEMVREFPRIARYYGRVITLFKSGEAAEVAQAIKPIIPPLGQMTVARLIQSPLLWLWQINWIHWVGFFAIGEKPTGSKRPVCFAPRSPRYYPAAD